MSRLSHQWYEKHEFLLTRANLHQEKSWGTKPPVKFIIQRNHGPPMSEKKRRLMEEKEVVVMVKMMEKMKGRGWNQMERDEFLIELIESIRGW